MTDIEGVAWAMRVLGDEGPYIRAALPRVLSETHSRYAATQGALGLSSADPYGLMWLGVPQALVEEFEGVAGVQIFRPKRGRYRLPMIDNVPLIPWRFAKDKTTNIDRVPFGQPVSTSRKSMFDPINAPSELPLGEAGQGAVVLEQLTPGQREELDAYGRAVTALAAEHRLVGVLAYASNPDALLSCYLGYASLQEDGHLRWAFRESLALTSGGRSQMHAVTTRDGRPAFDAGTPEKPDLRPRSPLEGNPTGEPVVAPDATASDE